jgi:hypothetical protein
MSVLVLNVSIVNLSLLRIWTHLSSVAESAQVGLIVPEEGWELENELDCSVIVEGLACSDSVELCITRIGGSNVLDLEALALLIVESDTQCRKKLSEKLVPWNLCLYNSVSQRTIRM